LLVAALVDTVLVVAAAQAVIERQPVHLEVEHLPNQN